MTRNTLNALCLSLLSLLAIACGDAGGAPVEEDTDLGGVLAGEEGGNDDDANIEEGDNDIDGNIEEDADDEQDARTLMTKRNSPRYSRRRESSRSTS